MRGVSAMHPHVPQLPVWYSMPVGAQVAVLSTLLNYHVSSGVSMHKTG